MSAVDTGAVYEQVRQAFIGMLAAQPSDGLQIHVPATPVWTVHDVLAHVVGLATDLNALHFPEDDDLGGEAWNAAQVHARRHRSFDDLVAEWDHGAPTFEHGLRAFGYEFGSHFVADLHAHYHDVRAALGLPDRPDAVAVAVSLDHYLGYLDERLTERGDGAVRFTVGNTDRVVGAGPVVATLRAEPFDVLRSVSARRSLRLVRLMNWEGDVEAAISLLQSAFHGGYTFPD
jgi:uncharacterized protein (TIGR03083 family)